MKKNKHNINLENWEIIRNLSREEYLTLNLPKNTRAWYKCLHCGETKHFLNQSFKTNELTCRCKKQKEEDNATGVWRSNLDNWEKISQLSVKERASLGLNTRTPYATYRCVTCKEFKISRSQSFKTRPLYCDNGCCGWGRGTQVIKGLNDIATIRPDLVKYFANKDEAYSYRVTSNQRILLKCPCCGHSKEVYITNFTRHGFSCPKCSDGYSYPEKVVTNVLKQLGVDFQSQLTSSVFTWCGRKRYDFYVPSLNLIIEAHGKQHYVGTGWKTREDERENDIDKWMLAQLKLGKGLKYVILDCSESKIDFIKHSVLSSPLAQLFDLSLIDWKEIGRQSETNIMLEVVDYYNKTKQSTMEIAKVFNITYKTVGDYLKRGTKIGLCNYSGEQVKEERKTKVIGINMRTKELVSFNSQTEADKAGYSQGNVSACCRGKKSCAHGYVWLYEPDYVSKQADEIDAMIKKAKQALKLKTPTPVIGVSVESGHTIRFESQCEAGRNGFVTTKICACIKGRRKSHYGYKWFYEQDYLQMQEQANIA